MPTVMSPECEQGELGKRRVAWKAFPAGLLWESRPGLLLLLSIPDQAVAVSTQRTCQLAIQDGTTT